MAYDLEEQEQLATLKAWWKQYGNLVTWVVIAALAAYAGWLHHLLPFREAKILAEDRPY